MTTQNENDIKGSPNGDDHDAQSDPRPKWPFWIGTGGRFPSESVAVFIGMRNMGQLIKGLRPRQDLDMAVLVPLPEADGRGPLQARLLIRHIGEERAAEARRRARRKAAKNGQTASEKRLKAAEYVMLLSSLPAEQVSADQLFQLYRLRWQIELAFKRFKSLMGLDELRAKDPKLVRSCLYAKLILALITEDLTTKLLDSFPSAPGRAAALAVAAPAAHLSATGHHDPWQRQP